MEVENVGVKRKMDVLELTFLSGEWCKSWRQFVGVVVNLKPI